MGLQNPLLEFNAPGNKPGDRACEAHITKTEEPT